MKDSISVEKDDYEGEGWYDRWDGVNILRRVLVCLDWKDINDISVDALIEFLFLTEKCLIKSGKTEEDANDIAADYISSLLEDHAKIMKKYDTDWIVSLKDGERHYWGKDGSWTCSRPRSLVDILT